LIFIYLTEIVLMVARTAREIIRWLESLYLTYPIIVPKW